MPFFETAGGAAAIQGATTLLGSVFSGGQKKGPSMQDQIGTQGDLTWDQLQTRHRFGEKYGIHPLVMMGINPSSGGLVPQNYSTPSSMGQNLGRAIAAGVQGYQEKQLQNLAVERAELENDLLKAQIKNQANLSPGNPPYVADSNIPGQGQPNSLTGTNRANAPIMRTWNTGYGTEKELPNAEELSEAIEALGPIGGPMAMNDIKLKRALGKRQYDMVRKRARASIHPSKWVKNFNPAKNAWHRQILLNYNKIQADYKWQKNRKW